MYNSVFHGRSYSLRHHADQWTAAAEARGNDSRRWNKGRNVSRLNELLQIQSGPDYGKK